MTGLELWPEWTARAACRGAPKEDIEFAFGRSEEQQAFIATYCRDCYVQQECGEYGIDEPGVYGGLTQKTRSNRMGRTMQDGRATFRRRGAA